MRGVTLVGDYVAAQISCSRTAIAFSRVLYLLQACGSVPAYEAIEPK